MKNTIIFLGLLGIIGFSGCASNEGASTGYASTSPTKESDFFSIPMEKITNKAQFYEYDDSGVKIKFFVVKGSDNSIKAAFDACDVCYYSKKGYRQEGSNMICNNCGNQYPIDGLGTENRNPGGCWPSYLPNKVVGDDIIIQKSDLRDGKYMFA